MTVIIIIVALAALGLLGFVTKSIIAMLVGAAGLAISFLMFCTGTMFSLLGNVIAFVISLVVLLAVIIFIPALLFVIIPGIFLAYLFARKKGYCGSARDMLKRKAIA